MCNLSSGTAVSTSKDTETYCFWGLKPSQPAIGPLPPSAAMRYLAWNFSEVVATSQASPCQLIPVTVQPASNCAPRSFAFSTRKLSNTSRLTMVMGSEVLRSVVTESPIFQVNFTPVTVLSITGAKSKSK